VLPRARGILADVTGVGQALGAPPRAYLTATVPTNDHPVGGLAVLVANCAAKGRL
jgi:hypothetical protein